MDSQPKVYHGTTDIHLPPQGNPPPYNDPGQPGYYPHPVYPAPGPQIQYVQSPGVQTSMTMAPAVIVMQQMGPRPTHVTCKSCHAEVVTRVEASATTRTHLFALILCLIGCWPCVCVPYCMDDCMNANHYCPNCNSYIGSHMN